MRGHVTRMRHRWGNAGVAAGRRDAALSKRRVVVGVNDEMRRAGVSRIFGEDFLEDGRCLQLIGVGKIRFRR
jgi:hypothetical protein